ncbi:DUF2092 domain-containing protein [Aquabacterium sp. A7-Y]|uniref:DUF2092 domain-containing protein n=1 Tax=Aquabacterium sp. A7-Y TaxID=1349605 RepID=UPI00223E6255|nr:DUF2092 domain-containing protein [Aquabacterium sp. A7-Y]MCW7538550.1 DUF2092 domain-containing protein [Aquabacterium sp. A7-Y]
MLIAVLSALLASAGWAHNVQTAALTHPGPPPLATAEETPIDPRAATALQRMGRYLQSQHFLGLRAKASSEQVLPNGQKIQIDFALRMWVRQPDGLRLDVTSDRGLPRFSQFYFNGKTFAAFGQSTGSYARVSMAASLKEFTARLSGDYGLRLPLVDLFTWAGGPEHLSRLISAAALGTTSIAGLPCDHYAFRQEGLDWQLWIQHGEHPLPRRIVITVTDDPAQPRQSVEMDWSLNVPVAAAVFAFEPPAGSQEVPMPRDEESVADLP